MDLVETCIYSKLLNFLASSELNFLDHSYKYPSSMEKSIDCHFNRMIYVTYNFHIQYKIENKKKTHTHTFLLFLTMQIPFATEQK